MFHVLVLFVDETCIKKFWQRINLKVNCEGNISTVGSGMCFLLSTRAQISPFSHHLNTSHSTCAQASMLPLSLCPLCSSNRHDHFLPGVRTTMAQTRSFTSIGPSLWNCLPPPLRSSILSLPLSSSLSGLKSYLFPGAETH